MDRSRIAADVAAFHESVPGPAGTPSLRACLHDEEHGELIDALDEVVSRGDPQVSADTSERNQQAALLLVARELADVVYVAYGTAHTLGIDLDAALAEVSRANLDKVTGAGLPLLRDDGKVLKPPGWVPPDMTAVLR